MRYWDPGSRANAATPGVPRLATLPEQHASLAWGRRREDSSYHGASNGGDDGLVHRLESPRHLRGGIDPDGASGTSRTSCGGLVRETGSRQRGMRRARTAADAGTREANRVSYLSMFRCSSPCLYSKSLSSECTLCVSVYRTVASCIHAGRLISDLSMPPRRL